MSTGSRDVFGACLGLAILVAWTAARASPQDPFTQDVVSAANATSQPKVIVKHLPTFVGGLIAAPEGQFRGEFIVERDGAVRSVRMIDAASTYAAFAQETIASIRKWKFEPGLVGAEPVRVLATVTVTFAPGKLPGRGAVREGILATLAVDGVDDQFGKDLPRLGQATGIVWPRVTREVKPVYPAELKGEKPNGTVELEVVVSATGAVGPIRIIRSTDDRFDNAAIECGRQWKFAPATKDGQPLAVVVRLGLDFRGR